MKFIRLTDYILNVKNIQCVIEADNKNLLHIEFNNSDLNITIKKQEWNKAVREAGVPSLQWID